MRGVKFISEVPYSGYGRAALGYIRGLRAAGIPVTWTPMVPGKRWGMWLEPFGGTHLPEEDFGEIVNQPIDYDTVIIHLVPEYYPRWCAQETGKALIGLTVWEFERLPPHWPEILNRMNALIVPCNWNRETFLAGGVTAPIAVIPHIPTRHETARPLPITGVETEDFLFFTISSWNERKAPHLSLKSYLSAFTATDKVALVIKTANLNERRRRPGFMWHHILRHFATTRRDISRIRRTSGSSARVSVITDLLTASEMEALVARGDCYISLTRSEGWGMGAYEAAFSGKPVIITGYGGHLDFLPADLAYHVSYRMAPCAERSDPPKPELVWAEPDLEQGARIMKEVFASPGEARQRGLRLQQFVRRSFVEDRIMAKLLHFIGSLSL